MGLTIDKNDPELGYGSDDKPVPQQKKYLVLSMEERAKGFVRPYRDTYLHEVCHTTTTMGRVISETYARDPGFYGATYCCHCRKHRPVGENGEFVWAGTSIKVGT